jgi:acetyl esterase/lipase
VERSTEDLRREPGSDGRRPPAAPTIAYGRHPDQVANLHLPFGDGPFPVVVLLHGGFWRSRWDRTLMTALAHNLVGRGIAAWNVEYRRVGQEGGGWPGTLLDVAAAVDRLAELDQIDADRVATCGHSAGGHLALWLAARHRLPENAAGASPVVQPRAAVGLAAVTDLADCHARGLGDGAVDELLGGDPGDVPDRYAVADPLPLAPLGIRQLLVHGDHDEVVPVDQSRSYARAAGAEAELVEVRGADHFDVIDPAHEAWRTVADRLLRLLGPER